MPSAMTMSTILEGHSHDFASASWRLKSLPPLSFIISSATKMNAGSSVRQRLAAVITCCCRFLSLIWRAAQVAPMTTSQSAMVRL